MLPGVSLVVMVEVGCGGVVMSLLVSLFLGCCSSAAISSHESTSPDPANYTFISHCVP